MGKFRFAGKRLMLTYKTHLEKSTYISWLEDKQKPIKFIRLAHERGDTEDGYDHTHVLIKYDELMETTNERYWDYLEIHPHISRITTDTHWRVSLRYIAKEDKANEDVIPPASMAEGIWKNDTMADALRSVDSMKDVLGTIALYKYKPEEEHRAAIPKEWRPWQQQLLDVLKGRPDDRKIIWIYDPRGSSGKSVLAAYIEDYMDGILLTQMGGQRDTATIIANCERRNDRPFVIDLPRQAENKSIYDPIEAIKNGRMTAVKYEGKRLRWRPGHVVVMANFLPSPFAWSHDRYEVIHIEGGLAGRLTLDATRHTFHKENNTEPITP